MNNAYQQGFQAHENTNIPLNSEQNCNFVKIDTTKPFEDELGNNTPLQSNTVSGTTKKF